VDRENILWTESHTLGSVRLLQAFSENGASLSGEDYRERLERYVHTLKVPRAIAEWKPAGAIATGGNIETLADLAKAPRDRRGVAVLRLSALRKVIEKLASLTFEERVQKLGLRVDRADVILPAAVVYERVADLAGASEILVPRVGLKEGLVLDLVDELRNHTAHWDRREGEIRTAAILLGRRFFFDEAHASQVAKLSLTLFLELGELHGLKSRERRLLLAGALLHDIGQYVSYRGHHKHSQYLITHSELPGFSPAELTAVGLLARYHRRAEPKDSHPGFLDLSEADREVVRKLAAILRVADALDREHVARVASLRPRVESDAVVLEIETRGDLALEEWALQKKGQMFEGVYGKPIRLEAAPG
jgi:exopolyphosphatase/guanosine-5'-triphosphate,3'-diphosphate pyrophosphatase